MDGPGPFSPELLRQGQTYPRQQSHFQLCLCRPKSVDNFFQDSSPTNRIREPILTLMIVGHSAESMAAECDSEHSENSAFSIFLQGQSPRQNISIGVKPLRHSSTPEAEFHDRNSLLGYQPDSPLPCRAMVSRVCSFTATSLDRLKNV